MAVVLRLGSGLGGKRNLPFVHGLRFSSSSWVSFSHVLGRDRRGLNCPKVVDPIMKHPVEHETILLSIYSKPSIRNLQQCLTICSTCLWHLFRWVCIWGGACWVSFLQKSISFSDRHTFWGCYIGPECLQPQDLATREIQPTFHSGTSRHCCRIP